MRQSRLKKIRLFQLLLLTSITCNLKLFIDGELRNEVFFLSDAGSVKMFSVKEFNFSKQLFGVVYFSLGEFLVGGEAHQDFRPFVTLEFQAADAADYALARVGDVSGVIVKEEVYIVLMCEGRVGDEMVYPGFFAGIDIGTSRLLLFHHSESCVTIG